MGTERAGERSVMALIVATTIIGAGCATSGPALRAVPVEAWPDLELAIVSSPEIGASIDRSLAWLASAESAPFDTDELRRSEAALLEMRELLRSELDPGAMAAELPRRFRLEEAIGFDDHGTVLFTGYFAPEYDARRHPTERFRYPIYARPAHVPRGERWWTRVEIESDDLLAGHEIAWLADPLDVYLAHVNGSARLRLEGGDLLHVTHDGTNERPYTSLGRLLIEAGLVPEASMSMDAIRDVHARDPATVERLMLRNERFVFFEVVASGAWPRSALGITLTPMASIATDRAVFPACGLAVVVAELPDVSGVMRPTMWLVVDQDTGGAIRGPGRADLYFGAGDEAGARAGHVVSEGALYYLRPR